MADTGVKETSGSGSRKSSKQKDRKWLLYGGGGLLAFIFLAGRGGSTSSGSGGQLLSAYQQGLSDAGGLANANTGTYTGGSGSGSGSGGGSTSTGSGNGSVPTSGSTGASNGGPGTPAPIAASPIQGPNLNITVTPPPSGTGSNAGSKGHAKGHKGTVGHRGTGHHKKVSTKGNRPGGPGHLRGPGHGGGSISFPHPAQPHPTKPHPANKHGKHPATHNATGRGHKKASPVTMEAMDGAGHGVTVMGRDFPGATSFRMGAPRRTAAGMVRDVVIFYGGHTDVHTVLNGRDWLENTPGRNPVGSRPIPQYVGARTV